MRFFLLCYCILFCTGLFKLFGQSDYYRSTVFHSITVNDGLAHRTAHDLVQDQEGYIWIATNNGLNRYDGHTIQTYRWDIQDKYSIPDNRVNNLLTSKDGRLWIISGTGKLSWYDRTGERFLNLKLIPPGKNQELSTYSFSEDILGNVYIIGSDRNIYRIILQKDSPLKPNLVHLPILNSGIPSIGNFLIDRHNRFWIQTNSGEILCYELQDEGLYLKKKILDHGSLNLLNQDGDQLWLAKRHQIFRINLTSNELQPEPVCNLKLLVPDLNSGIRHILTDSDGRNWISTSRNGLIRLEKQDEKYSLQHFPGTSKTGDGISNNQVSSLLIDKYNVLWLGTQVGVFWTSLHQKPFYRISNTGEEDNSLVDNIVQAIYRNDHLWIGNRNGLSVIDTATKQIYRYTELPHFPRGTDFGGITSIFQDSKGQMWLGTGVGYLYRVNHPENPAQLSFTPIDGDHSNFSFRNINNILEDELGRLWVGTTYEGIFILNKDLVNGRYQFEHLAHLPKIVITNMYKDPFENTIWIGTSSHGLLQLQVNENGLYPSTFFQSKPNDLNSLSLNHTNPIVKSDPKTLWVGTIGGGLNKITFFSKDSIRYKWYTTHNGLADNTIHTIQVDDLGNLWLGGTGLSRFDPQTETFTHYRKEDGLQSNLFIVNSTFKDQYGRLYFGGPYGLNFFSPKKIKSVENYPDIVISSLKILNEPIEVGKVMNGRVILPKPINQLEQLTIKEKENDLTLELLALHHAAPTKNRLRYRLKGHLDQWIDVPDMKATINYSNLQKGDYTLQVMASNGDNMWAPDVKELRITVLPYWYKTFWAYLAYGLVLFWLMMLFRRNVIVQSNLRNNLKIAQVKLEKDHEIAEMKTRFFNNITHELRTPLTLIKGPVEELVSNHLISSDDQKSYYQIIHHNAARLFNLVNRLLDFRKAETGHFKMEATADDLIPFAREIFLSFQQLAKEKQIDFKFKGPDELKLYFDRDKMEIVLCNLLSNAFKYSDKGDRIDLTVRKLPDQCLIELSDTGRGISTEELDNIFNRFYQIARAESSQIIGTGIGLSMVKTIVELHQGKIDVHSQHGQGSTFSVYLPLGRDHLPDDQIVSRLPDVELINNYQGDLAITVPMEQEKPTATHTQRLLIVEDNPEIRRFIRAIFQPDFQIEEADNGETALTRLKTYQPQLIISDIMMEPMDGITFCTTIKEDPDLFHIPLILLTARTSNVYQVDGLSSGADAYITKPFNAQVLRAQAESLIKTRAALRHYYTDRITLAPKKISIPSEELLFLEKLITLIEERLESEDLTAENLATAMAMSHSTLYRKIKSYTGESINSFIRSIRLKQAAQLLSDSDLNISQIAFKVGFSDVNYFGKCFKHQFKVSPSGYRNNS